jgi:hypothetical protein
MERRGLGHRNNNNNNGGGGNGIMNTSQAPMINSASVTTPLSSVSSRHSYASNTPTPTTAAGEGGFAASASPSPPPAEATPIPSSSSSSSSSWRTTSAILTSIKRDAATEQSDLNARESELGLHSVRRQQAATAHANQQRTISAPAAAADVAAGIAAAERLDEKRGRPIGDNISPNGIGGYGVISPVGTPGHSILIIEGNDDANNSRRNDMKKPLLPQVSLVDHYQKFNTPTVISFTAPLYLVGSFQ